MTYQFKFDNASGWLKNEGSWADLVSVLARGDEAPGRFLYVRLPPSTRIIGAGDPSVLLLHLADSLLLKFFIPGGASHLHYIGACTEPVWSVPCSRLWWVLDELYCKLPAVVPKVLEETEKTILEYLSGGAHD